MILGGVEGAAHLLWAETVWVVLAHQSGWFREGQKGWWVAQWVGRLYL